MKIPRVFHRIWLGPRPMPPEFEVFGRTWERLHPGWKMKLWTDANLPALANRWAFRRSRSFAGKSNLLRYEILLRRGGVYVDTDFECRKNIEPIIRNVECFAGHYRDEEFEHGTYAVINTALLGAVPGHPFIRDLVEEAEANMRQVIDLTPISTYQTGPVFLTSVIQRHPEVKLFPSWVFYPYGPRERWRRHEAFPRAYAVHHWTLNALSALRKRPKRLGAGGKPCLSVALQPTAGCDALRLRWVLEGLCEQWVGDFEVLTPWGGERPDLQQVCGDFEHRLRLRPLSNSKGTAGRNIAVGSARAPRVLFLDADCIPDPEVVAIHGRYSGRPVLLYSFRRTYPAAKLFPFREVVDYGAILAHSLLVPSLYVTPSAHQWRRVNGFCFSAPTAAIREAGGFVETRSDGGVRALSGRLARAGCPSAPALDGATVTWLESGGNGARNTVR